MAKFLKKTIWAFMTALAVLVALISWRFFFGAQFMEDGPLAYHLLTNPISANLHFIFSPLALLVGGLQFSQKIRIKYTKFHRAVGFIYIASCLMGAFGSIPLAFITEASPTASAGFFLLAVFWLISTSMGIFHALQKSFRKHEVWMIRSYAFTYAAVTLRIYMSVTSAIYGNVSEEAYAFIAWACWVVNIFFAELLLNWQRKFAFLTKLKTTTPHRPP